MQITQKYTQPKMYYRKQNLLEIQRHWQFNFIDFSRVIQQGKLWYMNIKDLFGNKQINSYNTVITYTLTRSQQDLWKICTSCRNTAGLKLLINLLWFFFFFEPQIPIWQNILMKPGINSNSNIFIKKKKIHNSALEFTAREKKGSRFRPNAFVDMAWIFWKNISMKAFKERDGRQIRRTN